MTCGLLSEGGCCKTKGEKGGKKCALLTAVAVAVDEQLDGFVESELRLCRALDGSDGVNEADDGRVVCVARVVELEVDGRLARVRDQCQTEITSIA